MIFIFGWIFGELLIFLLIFRTFFFFFFFLFSITTQPSQFDVIKAFILSTTQMFYTGLVFAERCQFGWELILSGIVGASGAIG